MTMSRGQLVRYGAAALLALGAILMLQALWIPLKAQAAQLLLQRAWQQTLNDGGLHPPWPWADHYPVAALSAQAFGVNQIVLAGDEGSSLAFAPGENLSARGQPGGARVISGHRDTHFRFLENVSTGDRFRLTDPDGMTEYRVESVQIVDSTRVGIDPMALPDGLLLVTCYPFDSLRAGGPLRYVVAATRIQ